MHTKNTISARHRQLLSNNPPKKLGPLQQHNRMSTTTMIKKQSLPKKPGKPPQDIIKTSLFSLLTYLMHGRIDVLQLGGYFNNIKILHQNRLGYFCELVHSNNPGF